MRLWTFIFLLSLCINQAAAEQEKTIYGYVEKVKLLDNQLSVSAKLDTGALSASLNAIKITEKVINHKQYLKFLVPTKHGNIPFICEYAGRVMIKPRTDESKVHSILKAPIKRPVVKMWMRLDDKEKLIKVNLTNRKSFNYPLLLGRDAIIAFSGIVDPALRFTKKQKKLIRIKSEQ